MMCDTALIEKEIKKEVISQMFWEFMGIDYCMRKDLDDVCEDIYNKVFVPLLEKTRKKTAKEILDKIDYESNGQTKQITDLLRKQYGLEVDND